MKLVTVVLLLTFVFGAAAIGQIPQFMNHQGYVADSLGTGITGTLPMTFRLYDDSAAGSMLLSQAFPPVALNKGIFSVNLDVSSITFTGQYWLETEVNGQTLAPRTRLTSAPYALAPWASNGGDIYFNSKVGLGTSTPGANGLGYNRLEIADEDGFMSDVALRVAGTGGAAGLNFYKSRGTLASPAIANDGDILGAMLFYGYDGDSFERGAGVWGHVDGAPGAGTMPARLSFYTRSSSEGLSTEKMRLTGNGRLALGTKDPGAFGLDYLRLIIADEDGFLSDVGLRVAGTGGAAGLNYFKSRGTLDSPTIVNNNDILGAMLFYGYDGDSFERGAGVWGRVDGTPGAGIMPARLSFYTRDTVEATSSEKMRLTGDGRLGIGTTSPQGALDVSSTTGAFIVPRMTTTQRDALTPVDGMIIYNTSTSQFNFREGGVWVIK